MATTEQFDEILAYVNQAYPCSPTWARAYFPGPTHIDRAYAYYGIAATTEKIANDLIFAIASLGIGPEANGEYQTARHHAFTGENRVQDIMWIIGKPMPTAKQYKERVFATETPNPPTPPPPPPPPTPPPTPPDSGILGPLTARVKALEDELFAVQASLAAVRAWIAGGPK